MDEGLCTTGEEFHLRSTLARSHRDELGGVQLEIDGGLCG